MKHIDPCTDFRARLERSLEGRPIPREFEILSWHEHLLGCGACRELLEREEALDALLASMPDPHLSPDLARRVLARLRGVLARADGLDALLELDPDAQAPSGLAARVLERVRAGDDADNDARLERLLELDRALHIPDGLATRVLSGLDSERGQPVLRFPSRRLLLAAAAVVAFAALPLWFADEQVDPERVARIDRPSGAPADAELRAFLEQGGLEILDEPLLWTADDDLEIALATSLDSRYETVLDYDDPLDATPSSTKDEEQRDG